MFDELQNNSDYGRIFFENFFIVNMYQSFDHIMLGCKSKYFEEVEQGHIVPIYNIVFRTLGKNLVQIYSITKISEHNNFFI